MKTSILFLFISFSVWANSPQSVRDEVIKLVPTDLAALNSSITTQELVKRFKSKIKLKDKAALYLTYNSTFVDVTIRLKNNRFESFQYHAPKDLKEKTSDLYQKTWSVLSEKEKEKIERDMHSDNHAAGSVISIELPGQNMKLDFTNNEQKTLQSITVLDKKVKK